MHNYLSNHSWQRLEMARLDWGAYLYSLQVTHSRPPWLWTLRRKTWECYPGSALPPAVVMSLSLGLTGPSTRVDTTQAGSPAVRMDPRSGSKGRWQLCCHCYQLDSCVCARLLWKCKGCQEGPSGSECCPCLQVKCQGALCPSINSETISSVGLYGWLLHIFWRTLTINSNWSVDIIIYVLKAVCV